MRARPGFRLTRQATLSLLVSAAVSGAWAAPAGRVDFATGAVNATGPDGRSRLLTRGATFESGDTISTGAGARAHLRFSDGGYTSLQPDTQFRIDDYQFDGTTDGREKGFFSLLKGGLRTVTGLIGRSTKSTYRVTTATATIGVRGTGYLLKVTNSIEAHVGDGTLEISTQETPPRILLLPEHSSLALASPTATPVRTDPPIVPPAPAEGPARRGSSATGGAGESDTQQDTAPTTPPPPPTFVAGDRTTSSGTAAIVPAGSGLFGNLPPGSGYALAFSIGGEGNFCQVGCVNSGAGPQCGRPDVTLANGMLSFTQGPFFGGEFIESGFPTTIGQGTASFSGASVGNVAAIGVLKNGTVSLNSGSIMGVTFGPNEGAHGFLFLPTPNMPASGMATYNMVPGGFTMPTFSNNTGGGGLVPGGSVSMATLTANFAPTPSVSGSAYYMFPGGNAYMLNFSGGVNGAGFSGMGTFSRTAGMGSACSTSCTASVYGGFAGTANPTPPYAGEVVKVSGPGFSLNNAILLQR